MKSRLKYLKVGFLLIKKTIGKWQIFLSYNCTNRNRIICSGDFMYVFLQINIVIWIDNLLFLTKEFFTITALKVLQQPNLYQVLLSLPAKWDLRYFFNQFTFQTYWILYILRIMNIIWKIVRCIQSQTSYYYYNW